MKTKSKALLLVLCAVLLVVSSVFGTMAYLTSTQTITNTFTVGNVKITMDESKVTEYGVKVENEARVMTNAYKLIPNRTYVKDPQIHVDANSESCWLFVKIENGILNAEKTDGNTIANQLTTNGWTAIGENSNIYAYKEIVSAGENVNVFSEFTAAPSLTNDTIAAFANKTVVVTAYAIQSDGFTTAAAAWAAANSQFENTPNT